MPTVTSTHEALAIAEPGRQLHYWEAEFAAMTDTELIEQTWAALGTWAAVDENGADEARLYWMISEFFERHTPEANREVTARDFRALSSAERDVEMQAHDEGVARRARLREHLRRLDEGGDDA